MICCCLQKRKKRKREGEAGKVTSALLGPARRKQLGKIARISVLRAMVLLYQL